MFERFANVGSVRDFVGAFAAAADGNTGEFGDGHQ